MSATAARPTMRLLSQRLRVLQRIRPTPLSNNAFVQARLASSRYSQPAQRSSVDSPLSPALFTGPDNTFGSIGGNDLGKDILIEEAHQARREQEEQRQKARQKRMKSIKLLSIGLLVSVGAQAGIIWYIESSGMLEKHKLDASKESNETFQGKDIHVIGVGEGKRIVAEDQSGALELVETGTSSVPHFPKTIYLPTASDSSLDPNALAVPNTDANPGNRANLEEYNLVGLGIRSVSFLSIQVYVVGLYIRTTDITGLQARLVHHINPAASTLIPSEKEDLKSQLLDAEASHKIWSDLLDVPGIKTAWRVVPTRNTDFMHLRDGWITGINKRIAEDKKRNGNVPSEYDREDFGQSVRSFMSIFQGGKANRGSIMTLARTSNGGLDVFFTPKPEANSVEKETQLLGTIGDNRISKLIWMNYLAGDKVSSEAARQGVANGCVAMASRPIGSVETMVS